jgi:hypothetical protein
VDAGAAGQMRGGESLVLLAVGAVVIVLFSVRLCIATVLPAYCPSLRVFLQKNQREFDVECSISGRAYHISDPQGGASMWADLINAVLRVTSLAR